LIGAILEVPREVYKPFVAMSLPWLRSSLFLSSYI